MEIKIGRKYGYYDREGCLRDVFIPQRINESGFYIGTVTKICKETFIAEYTLDLIRCNYKPLWIEVKSTRLAKKLYPNAEEEDGMLILEEGC